MSIIDELPNKERYILLILERHRIMSFTEIQKSIKSNYWYAQKYLEDLKERGLILEKKYRKVRVFILTDKGRLVVNAIKKLYGL
ncbi:MAG: hypothetical protein DRJ32_01825 [Thermoprotei archaeon]|nr:MAG: hypothetical protein DRJ32_01825 [Thermoprotei archaeon]